MNNPYTQHPQQFGDSDRAGRWGSDENRGTQFEQQGNFGQYGNYGQGQQGNYGQRNDGQLRAGQPGTWSQRDTGGQRGGGDYGQSRYSPNFSGQGNYGQEWQRGGNYDDYGYEGNQQRGQWGQEYSPYSGQGQPEYEPNTVPRYNQPIRAESQRWGQPSRDWQQPWQGRSREYAGNTFDRQQETWPINQSRSQFGSGQNSGFTGQSYGGQHRGGEYGSEPMYGRASFQSAGDQRGAFGLQSDMQSHRGKGPKGYTRTDERIREEICELLSDDFQIDASEISVEVKDGIVTLEGTVQDRSQKHRVEDLADNCSGVKDVHNSLRVTRQAGASQQQSAGEKPQDKTASKNH